MNIGAIIKARRKARGLTQLNLAMRLGVTPQAVGKWERGESEPDLTLLCPLAKELNVTLETLFGLEQKAGYIPVDLSMEQLRDDLKARRTAAGLTQAELAAKLGLRPQTVSKWETGVCAPDLDYLNRLCALYGITPTALFSERVPQTAAHTPQAEPSPPAVAADKAHEHTPATRGAPLAAPTGTPAAAAKAPFFAGKPLRVLALVLVLALLLSAVLAPLLLFGGNASGQVSDGGSDITGGGTDEPEQEDGLPVYLSFQCTGGGALDNILDTLEARGIRALFLFTPDALAAAEGQLRRLVGSGHAVGLSVPGQSLDGARAALEEGAGLLEQLVRVRPHTVYLEGAASGVADALEREGWACWSANVDGRPDGRSQSTQANALLRTLEGRRSAARMLLDDSGESAGILSRLLPRMPRDAYWFQLALDTRI